MKFLTDAFDKLILWFSYIRPEWVLFGFAALIVAGFAAALAIRGRGVRRYISAFRDATEYLSSDKAGVLEANSAGYFFREYAVRFPSAMAARFEAYLAELDGKPSGVITEADCIKLPSIEAGRRAGAGVYEVILFGGAALSAALCLSDPKYIGIAVGLPLALGIFFRYTLKRRATSSNVVLSREFHTLMAAMDRAAVRRNDPLPTEDSVALANISALIEALIEEERDAQRYYYFNKIDALQKELRGERLGAIVENVDMICGKDTSRATLKLVFEMVAGSKNIYTTTEEVVVINGCLIKLTNAISKTDRGI